MATTLQELAEMLFDAELKFQVNNERNEIALQMGGLNAYKDNDNDDSLLIVIKLLEDGEYLEVFAPNAFKIPEDSEKAAMFLKTCAIIQWKTKLLQFEFDDNDGEVRPMIEFPLEDALVTQKQLKRCINGLTAIVDTYYPVLKKVTDEGIISFDELEKKDDMTRLLETFNNIPIETLEALIQRRKEL